MLNSWNNKQISVLNIAIIDKHLILQFFTVDNIPLAIKFLTVLLFNVSVNLIHLISR